MEKFSDGTNVQIIFLTDGQDNQNGGKLQQEQEGLKNFLTMKEQNNDMQSAIYCLGLSKNHNANLLNFLAQAGSQMGNFIYLDIGSKTLDEEMNDALSKCLGMAISETNQKDLFIVESDTSSFKKIRAKVEKQEEYDGDENNLKLSKVTYKTTFMARESDLFKKDLTITLKIGNDFQVEGILNAFLDDNIPETLQKEAELQFINQEIFKLIQTIQK